MKRTLSQRAWGTTGLFAALGVLLALAPAPYRTGTGPAAQAEEGRPPAKPYRIGYRILKAPVAGREPLTTALWYPTQAGPGKMTYRVVADEMVSDASPNAPPAKGPFPLLVYSHGGGGCAIMGAAHAESLAENGFVVAGIDHNDEFVVARSDESERPDPKRVLDWFSWAHSMSAGMHAGRPGAKFAHRPLEVKTAIDFVLQENASPASALYNLVDARKIGAFGVSFGAWTTQAVAGFYGPTFQDARIRAAAPIAGQVQKKIGSFSNIRVPVMIIFGSEETIVLGDPRSGSKSEGMLANYAAANPPKLLVEIKGARHLDFGGAGVSNREQRPAKASVSTAQVRNHDRVISVVNAYCVAFFRRYLLNDAAAEAALTARGENVQTLKHDLGRP